MEPTKSVLSIEAGAIVHDWMCNFKETKEMRCPWLHWLKYFQTQYGVNDNRLIEPPCHHCRYWMEED